MYEARLDIPGLAIGTVEGIESGGSVLVRCATSKETQRARVTWMKEAPDWTACRGLRVVLGFEKNRDDSPIILGLLDAPPPRTVTPNDSSTPATMNLKSEEELVIQCGKAKITLRADGRIIITGGYLVSRSSGVNKIKGGSVQIN